MTQKVKTYGLPPMQRFCLSSLARLACDRVSSPSNERFMVTSWENDNTQPITMSAIGCLSAIGAYKINRKYFLAGHI